MRESEIQLVASDVVPETIEPKDAPLFENCEEKIDIEIAPESGTLPLVVLGVYANCSAMSEYVMLLVRDVAFENSRE